MKHIIFCILFLFPVLLFAQYPNNPIKSRLGWQTTGDGLVYRGAGAPAYSPGTLFNAWMYLDTTNYTLYMYRNFQWTKLPLVNNGLTFDGSYVQLGGTLVENTTVEKSSYTFNLGKVSGANNGYLSFYGTDPYYAGILTTKDGTESGLTIGNKVWGFEIDDGSHVSSLSGTRFGFDATYLGTLGVSQFKMDSTRFFLRGLNSYASHTAADANVGEYQLYKINNSRAIYLKNSTVTSQDILGTGTADRLARWTGTNTLGAGSWSDNLTRLQAQVPVQFQSVTTAGLPTGVTGYTVYNTTTNGPAWYQGSRWAYGLESTFARGTATRVPFFDANGQVTDNAAATINLTGVLGRMEIRGSIDQKTLVVRRTNSSQTTNVFEVASESGGSITSINALGYINSTDLRLQNNGRTALRGVTNFSTFADNVASTFFQVSNSSDGNRLLFTSESGNPLARLAFLSTGAYVYNGSFASSPAPVSQFAVINTVSATQPMTIKLANPQNVDAFRITSSADVKLFHVENDGKVSIKNSTTAARDLDVNGEVRIRDLTTDSPVDIVGADGDGDLGRFSLSGLSVSGGTLTAQNIGNTNLTLSGNRTLTGAGYWLKYPNMEFNIGDTTWLFSKGVRPYLYARSKTYKPNQDSVAGQIILNTNGPQANLQLFGSANASNNFSGAIFLYDLSANTAKNKGWFVANDQRDLTEDGLNFKQVGTGFSGFNTHYIMRNNGTFTVGAPTLSPVMAISHDTVLIGKLPIINANINGNVAYSEAPFKVVNLGIVGSPSASNKVIVNAKFYIGTDSTLKFDPANDLLQLSQYGTGTKEAADLSKTQSAYIAGIATDGTVLDLERKRDTTIYIDDADYDFSAAITTAQIASRFNRVILWMTTTGAAGSDSEITLHTPDANLMQVEYLIHSVDEAGGFANVIRFGTNNAVDSTNGLVSSYFPAAGQGVGIRAGLRSGVYKYRYY